MFIAIHCAGMPFNGDTIPSGKSLGGSESAAYYMAKELVSLGHTVTLFTNFQHFNDKKEVVGQYWDGVLYEWLGNVNEQFPLGDRFHLVMQSPFDVCIIQRHPFAFIKPVNAKLTLWWLHDLATYARQGHVQAHLLNIDKILTVSEWHRQQVSKVYDIPLDSIIATTNGVDYSMFEGLEGIEREPRSLFYMARPERGLINLVGEDGIMEELHDCHLYVCGYDNTTPEMATFYNYLWQRCEALPNVTNLGHLGKRKLYEAMAHAELYVYPTTFEDTSCIAALEANAAGLPVIGSDWSATTETLQGGGSILLPLKDGQVDKKEFAKTVRMVFSQPSKLESLRKKALAKRQTWKDAALQWDNIFREELEKKNECSLRLAKHFERQSDIVAADKMGLVSLIDEYEKKYKFYFNDDFAAHYKAYYEYEAARGVVYGPEDLGRNNRFNVVLSRIMELQPKTCLDYGCAHGHYPMNIIARTPKDSIHITGLDIAASNIEKAKTWAKQAGMESQTKFVKGDIDYLKDHPELKYDLVLCSEVLEHVKDPQALIDELMLHINDGGSLLGTTPYGPWEAMGFKEHYPWRAHLHHFERQDLKEMFGDFLNFKLLAVPHSGELGHFVWTFSKTDKPCGQIDYARKEWMQAPRETLSVCMIAYNEEDSIGKTLKTVADIADEIIVAIDEKTTDKTEEICHKYGAKTFRIKSPMDIGFDAARNLSIAKASMDWILWIDADETLEGTNNLTKYLRPNCFNGYAIKQHHFAVEPACLLQTDMPVRLFRNNKGIKFFGVVHEHPETEINKGAGKVMILDDISIMHTGYSTEAIRRKRFERNWPLMQKDREKYPDRALGKFLWIRDLAHYNRYMFERLKQVTPDMETRAKEAVKIWHELLDAKQTRMAVEGLVYYTQAVELLTAGRGIQFAVDMSASKLNGGARLPKQPIAAMFESKKDIEQLTSLLIETNIGEYENRYYA
jgi:glycosyltransferase involved in cell wall biosynthesis/2-polyprenyl-3-methyl-5-hydroxy-6-metoxy-1,4-benzoquinol methylase